MTNTTTKKNEALARLKEIITPGTTVFTVLRSVSSNGTFRRLDFYVIKDNRPIWITVSVADALGLRYSMKDLQQSKGAGVSGCGMDMGFHCVHNLAIAVLCDGEAYNHDKVYSIKQTWL